MYRIPRINVHAIIFEDALSFQKQVHVRIFENEMTYNKQLITIST